MSAAIGVYWFSAICGAEKHSYFRKYILLTLILVGLWSAWASASALEGQQWRQVASLKGIPSAQGMNVPSIYIFFDPNCPASARLYRSTISSKPFSSVEAVWIPVHYMSSSSIGKSAALLRSGKFSAISKNFAGFDFSKRAGAISPVAPSPEERREMDKADRVWLGLTDTPGTPMIVYEDQSGAPHVHLGYAQTDILEKIVSGAPSPRMPLYDGSK